jgi:hypothetical protein
MLRLFWTNVRVRWEEWRRRRRPEAIDIVTEWERFTPYRVDLDARRRRQHAAAQRQRNKY